MRISPEQQTAYLNHALNFSDEERAKVLAYSFWFPKTIIDAHSHSNLDDHVGDIPPKTFNHMMSTFPSFSIEESRLLNAAFYPGITVRSLRFPHVFRGIDHRAANEYLLANQNDGDRAAVFGLPEDIPYTNDMLEDPRVAALKMYPAYVEPSARHVYQYFKPEILEKASRVGVPIVLHPPKPVTETASQIVQIKRDFPNLKVSVAHLGLTKFNIPGLQEAYDMLAEETDVSMDTALNPSVDVHYMAISTLGIGRVLFGTDQPLDLLRSVPYIHPERGERITTEFRYHWQDPEEQEKYKVHARGAIHSHWLCLDALKSAIDRLPESERELAKTKILHDNAANLFSFS